MEQFNRGIYDYIIATDEASTSQTVRETRRKLRGKRKRDREYGVARGIDFKGEYIYVRMNIHVCINALYMFPLNRGHFVENLPVIYRF